MRFTKLCFQKQIVFSKHVHKYNSQQDDRKLETADLRMYTKIDKIIDKAWGRFQYGQGDSMFLTSSFALVVTGNRRDPLRFERIHNNFDETAEVIE